MNKKPIAGSQEKEPAKTSFLSRAAVTLLTAVLALNAVSLVVRVTSDSGWRYAYEYSEMQGAMDRNDYPALLDMVRQNQAIGAETERDTSEFAAVAVCYEAASMYYALQKAGETEKANEQLKRLQEAEKGLVSPAFTEAGAHIREKFSVGE